jgi:large subunit ribosomal protein L30
VQGLGLRRIRHTVEVVDTPAMRGMIHKVRHLVDGRVDVSGGKGSWI